MEIIRKCDDCGVRLVIYRSGDNYIEAKCPECGRRYLFTESKKIKL